MMTLVHVAMVLVAIVSLFGWPVTVLVEDEEGER